MHACSRVIEFSDADNRSRNKGTSDGSADNAAIWAGGDEWELQLIPDK